jgi:hypothetical protein
MLKVIVWEAWDVTAIALLFLLVLPSLAAVGFRLSQQLVGCCDALQSA